jgi:hypothetical protein
MVARPLHVYDQTVLEIAIVNVSLFGGGADG